MLKNLNIPSFKEITDIIIPYIKLADKNKWLLILLTLIVMYLVYKCFNANLSIEEGFSLNDNKAYVLKNKNLYDEFYVALYDDLVEDPNKVEGEMLQVMEVCKMDKSSKVLDVGCGTGHHVSYMKENDVDVIGLDNSQAMINKSKKNYPKCKFIRANATDSFAFSTNDFTHITCFYFTLYYMKDKKNFFENCNNWLVDKGYLVIHLVDKYKFDPIINAGDPFSILDVQNYSKDRINSSIVEFNTFSYSSKFNLIENSNIAKFIETFKFKDNGRIRQNEHVLYMDKQTSIVSTAKDSGFTFVDRIDLATISYENQFLYVLQNNK